MEESILTSIKKLLGIEEDYEVFDEDVIIHINSAFSILTQLGLGPSNGFAIKDKTSAWSDFIPKESMFGLVKTYVFLKVKLIFDPPLTSTVVESMTQQISEYEWRLNVMAETENKEENSK